MSDKTMDLHWPMRGVVRREPLRTPQNARGPYPAPWAVNVRIDDPISRRMRGGSRPGLTKYISEEFDTIVDMASISVSRTTGAAVILFVLDSAIKAFEGGTLETRVSYLENESGSILTDEDENRIVVGTTTVPVGFLVTGHQNVYAVTSNAIVKMDPKTGQTDDLLATDGTVPTGCTFGAVYRDRMVASGGDNAIYMSRVGDYGDWDYGAHVDDSNRPLVFQLALANEVGPLPTAMIPHKDAYLLVASQRSLWVVQGDPAADGSLRRISENVGILSKRAWCKIEDTICFLSEDGIYRVNGDGSELTPLSEETVPDELRDIDTSTTTVVMGYEKDRQAVHVYLTGGSGTHWLYELGPQAWWPMRLQSGHSPVVMAQHDGELLLAGGDDYIRKVGGDNDDGAAVESHVAIGPMRMATTGRYGRLMKLHAMIAAGGGGNVNWRIVTGDTAEEAADNVKLAIEAFQSGGDYSSYVSASGNWPSGSRSIMAYPRTRGVWCCLWLQATDKWAFEGARMETSISGMWRGTTASVVPAGVVSTSSSPSASPSSTPSASTSGSPSASPSTSPSSSPSSSPSAT